MFTSTTYTSASRLSRYFGETENKHLYYQSGTELHGGWDGLASSYLGLSGPVRSNDFRDLAQNRMPGSIKRLTQRNDKNRVSGWDITISLPKSLSVKFALTGDQKLLDIYRAGLSDQLQDMEKHAGTRVRRNGVNSFRTTGNWVCAVYEHRTTRPVNGMPDPQLHFHVVVFNATWDQKEKRWKALYIKPIIDNLGHFSSTFKARLMKRLKDAGYPVTINDNAFELTGMEPYIERFSNRKRVIEQAAEDLGIKSPKAKAGLGRQTREAKPSKLTWPRLVKKWQARVTPKELAFITELGAPRPQQSPAGDGPAWAYDPVFSNPLWDPEQEMPERRAQEEREKKRAKIEAHRHQKAKSRQADTKRWTQQEFEPPPNDWDQRTQSKHESTHQTDSSRQDGDSAESREQDNTEQRKYRYEDGRQIPLPLGREKAWDNAWWRRKEGPRQDPDPRTVEVPEAARTAFKAARKEFFASEEVGSHLALRSLILKHGKGEITPEEATAALFQSDLRHEVIEGKSFFGESKTYSQQQRIRTFARNGKGQCLVQLGPSAYFSKSMFELRDWDKALLDTLFKSRDKLTLVKHPGTRRRAAFATTAIDGIMQHGHDVVMLGATHRTVEAMKARYLFNRPAMTVDHYLQEERGDALLPKPQIMPHPMTVFWVEDAGSLSTRQLGELVELAERKKCRIVLLGDEKSPRSMEGGNPIAMLRTGGIRSIESKLIKSREDQADNDRHYMENESGIDICKRMDFRGQISQVLDSDEVYRSVADRFVDALKNKRTALVVAPDYETHTNVTAAIRFCLREAGILKKREKKVLQRRPVWLGDNWKEARGNIKSGMTIHFHKPHLGFKMGDKARILATGPGGVLVVWGRGLKLTIRPKLKNISVTEKEEIALSRGDRVQLTRSTNSKLFGFRLRAGKVLEVERVTPDTIIFKSGHAIPRDWGHFIHAYACMPWQVQGRRVDDVIVASHQTAWGGLGREQMLAALDAAKQSFHCVVDNAEDLAAALDNQKPRLSAADLVERPDYVYEQHQRHEAWQQQQRERMNDQHRRTHHV